LEIARFWPNVAHRANVPQGRAGFVEYVYLEQMDTMSTGGNFRNAAMQQ